MASKPKFVEDSSSFPPSFFLLKKFINEENCKEIIEIIDTQITKVTPFEIYSMYNGKPFNCFMTNCGEYDWISDGPNGYSYRKENLNGIKWLPMPELFKKISLDALKETIKIIPEGYDPQSCLINLYPPGNDGGKLGSHVDNTEFCSIPIISFSLGASAIFKVETIGNILLEEGDVCIMSGESRFVRHSITKILDSKKPRIALTIRQVYNGPPVSYRHMK